MSKRGRFEQTTALTNERLCQSITPRAIRP
jgi:hypothetical protein